MPDFQPTREKLAVVTTKYWGNQGVRLSVGFLDSPSKALRQMILAHMNAWNKTANVKFMETASASSARVRIERMGGPNGGYWSYLGTDIDLIPAGQPTMNLEAFTENTLESEFRRVVRHEAGHTLGFPHEHMRLELVEQIDVDLAIEYFRRTQGWSEDEVRQQVLTPLEDGSILGTPNTDPFSIMCYQITGEITVTGEPIIGGIDIDEEDRQFAATIYPKPLPNHIVNDKMTASSSFVPAEALSIFGKLLDAQWAQTRIFEQILHISSGPSLGEADLISVPRKRAAGGGGGQISSKEDLEKVVIDTIVAETGTAGITTGTSFSEDLGLDPNSVADLYIPVRDAVIQSGCTIQHFNSNDFASNDTVGDAIDALEAAIPEVS